MLSLAFHSNLSRDSVRGMCEYWNVQSHCLAGVNGREAGKLTRADTPVGRIHSPPSAKKVQLFRRIAKSQSKALPTSTLPHNGTYNSPYDDIESTGPRSNPPRLLRAPPQNFIRCFNKNHLRSENFPAGRRRRRSRRRVRFSSYMVDSDHKEAHR